MQESKSVESSDLGEIYFVPKGHFSCHAMKYSYSTSHAVKLANHLRMPLTCMSDSVFFEYFRAIGLNIGLGPFKNKNSFQRFLPSGST